MNVKLHYLSASCPQLHQVRCDNFSDIVVYLLADHCDHQLNCQLIVTAAVRTSLPPNLFVARLNVSPVIWD